MPPSSITAEYLGTHPRWEPRLRMVELGGPSPTPAEYLGPHPRWEPRLRRVGLGDCCIPSLVGTTPRLIDRRKPCGNGDMKYSLTSPLYRRTSK